MIKSCFKFSDSIFRSGEYTLTDEDRVKWSQHLQECSDCREQSAMHADLTSTYSQAPQVELPDDFNTRLFRELEAYTQVKPIKKSIICWEIVYWLLAGAVSLFILFNTGLLSRDALTGLLPYLVLIAAPLSFIITLFPRSLAGGLLRVAAPLLRDEMT